MSSVRSYKEACDRIANGECYNVALKVLADESHGSKEDRLLIDLPANTLAGFSLELVLKGFLLLNNVSSSKVRRYGHDLQAILEKCREYDFPRVEHLDYLISTLGEGHKSLNYRYINSGDTFDKFSWKLVMPILDNVLSAVMQKLRERTAEIAADGTQRAQFETAEAYSSNVGLTHK